LAHLLLIFIWRFDWLERLERYRLFDDFEKFDLLDHVNTVACAPEGMKEAFPGVGWGIADECEVVLGIAIPDLVGAGVLGREDFHLPPCKLAVGMYFVDMRTPGMLVTPDFTLARILGIDGSHRSRGTRLGSTTWIS